MSIMSIERPQSTPISQNYRINTEMTGMHCGHCKNVGLIFGNYSGYSNRFSGSFSASRIFFRLLFS